MVAPANIRRIDEALSRLESRASHRLKAIQAQAGESDAVWHVDKYARSV